MPKTHKRAFSRLEILVLIIILVVAIGFLLPMVRHTHPTGHRKPMCKSNLRQLGIALTMYVDMHGGGKYYPYPTQDGNYAEPKGADLEPGEGFSGASFLAALYWSGVLTEPGVLICPTSDDDNHDGADLGTNPTADDGTNIPGWNKQFEQPDGTHVSYASKAQWTVPGGEPLTVDDVKPEDILASDDTDAEPNHDDGFCVLYADGHVDWLPTKNVYGGENGMVGRVKPLDKVDN